MYALNVQTDDLWWSTASNMGHQPEHQDTSMISTKYRYIERIVREPIKIELHLHNMD
jgi:hypothetical protein